jgi:hypothetical protein
MISIRTSQVVQLAAVNFVFGRGRTSQAVQLGLRSNRNNQLPVHGPLLFAALLL